jgi:hypothetical protein
MYNTNAGYYIRLTVYPKPSMVLAQLPLKKTRFFALLRPANTPPRPQARGPSCS